MYALVQEHVPGGRFIAPAVLTVAVLAFGAWSFGVLYAHAIAPLATRLASLGTPQHQWAWLWAVVIVGFVATGIGGAWLSRRLRATAAEARTDLRAAMRLAGIDDIERQLLALDQRTKHLDDP